MAPTAAIIGNVTVEEGCSIWFSAVIRGDDMPILIGAGCNIQDGAVVHATEGVAAVVLGRDVIVGHGAILHGCTVEDGAMVGIGAVILDGAIIGAGAIVAGGAVVPPNKRVPCGELWVGSPAVRRREVGEAERAYLAYAPTHYRSRAAQYLTAGLGSPR